MSKNSFFLMREEQIATMYDSTFSKKDAIKQGAQIVKNVIDNGNISKHEFTANIARLKAVIDTAFELIKENIKDEKTTVLGVDFTPVNGGNVLNYNEDAIWVELKYELECRQELLKLAQKQFTLDAGGIQVPKVGKTNRKDSLTLKF